MPAFKFRITFEDVEDVSRDIEIKPNQNFEDFHFAIQNAIGFDAKHKAEFYLSDDLWRKGKKVSFEKLSQIKLVDVIDNPHQKFIYEYDEGNWVLNIELFKIVPDEEGETYPRCVKSIGKAPKQYKKIDLKPPVSTLIDEDTSLTKEEENIDEARIYSEAADIDIESISDDDDIETGFSEEVDETEDSNEDENEFRDYDDNNFTFGNSDEDY
ncbi:MAG: IS1096 element passenger TnpR family protein [Bacteroidia bacterium]